MPIRKMRLALGLLLLLVSLALLAWSLWPLGTQVHSLPVPPGELQLPTHVSLYWIGLVL